MTMLPLVDGKYRSSMREYFAWNKIRDRCLNPSCPTYKYYGNRGIKICGRWLESFESFYEDIGARPTPKHSLDRINNDANYSCGHCDECIANGWPMNCRWATKLEQMNNRRNSSLITFEGRTLTVREWSRELKTDFQSIYIRSKKGLSVEKVLFGMKRQNKQTYVEPDEKLKNIHRRDHPPGPMKDCRTCKREKSIRSYYKRHKEIECTDCKKKLNSFYIKRHYLTKTHLSHQNKDPT